MKLWKFGIALSLTAVFGLMACDDSSSADEKDKIGIDDDSYVAGKVACVVTSPKDPFVTETRMNDLKIKTTATFEKGAMVTVMEYNQEMPKDTCEHYKLQSNVDVTCAEDGKSIKVTDKNIKTAADFEAMTSLLGSACEKVNGNDIADVKKDDIDLSKIKKCTEENKDEEFIVEGTGVSLVCDGEFWVPAKVECSDEDEVKDFGTIELVCKDKKWTFETEEDCTKAMKKSETLLELVKVSATCVDGAWVIDLPKAEETTTAEE